MVLCAAATVCAHQDRCSAATSAPELALLAVLVLLPILAACYQPSLARLQPRSLYSTGYYHTGLESELIGCRMCMPPRICAASGLLAVVVLLVLGFVPTFFLLLASPDPCDTALGACGSISCACGNFLQKGYVWMFVTLFVASMLLMKVTPTLTPTLALALTPSPNPSLILTRAPTRSPTRTLTRTPTRTPPEHTPGVCRHAGSSQPARPGTQGSACPWVSAALPHRYIP